MKKEGKKSNFGEIRGPTEVRVGQGIMKRESIFGGLIQEGFMGRNPPDSGRVVRDSRNVLGRREGRRERPEGGVVDRQLGG